MGKLATPDWIREGFDSKADWEKSHGVSKKKKSEKTFRLRICPKCGSDQVGVVLGEEEGKNRGEWECKKCGWRGTDIKEEELNEDQFMKYLDEQGAEVI
jgi:transcription elongation factor Elf1